MDSNRRATESSKKTWNLSCNSLLFDSIRWFLCVFSICLEAFHWDEEFDTNFPHIRVLYFNQRFFSARKKCDSQWTLRVHHFFASDSLFLSQCARPSQIKNNAAPAKDKRINYQLQISSWFNKTRFFQLGHRGRNRSQQKWLYSFKFYFIERIIDSIRNPNYWREWLKCLCLKNRFKKTCWIMQIARHGSLIV